MINVFWIPVGWKVFVILYEEDNVICWVNAKGIYLHLYSIALRTLLLSAIINFTSNKLTRFYAQLNWYFFQNFSLCCSSSIKCKLLTFYLVFFTAFKSLLYNPVSRIWACSQSYRNQSVYYLKIRKVKLLLSAVTIVPLKHWYCNYFCILWQIVYKVLVTHSILKHIIITDIYNIGVYLQRLNLFALKNWNFIQIQNNMIATCSSPVI